MPVYIFAECGRYGLNRRGHYVLGSLRAHSLMVNYLLNNDATFNSINDILINRLRNHRGKAPQKE